MNRLMNDARLQSLSLDNLFVILLTFESFRIRPGDQHKVPSSMGHAPSLAPTASAPSLAIARRAAGWRKVGYTMRLGISPRFESWETPLVPVRAE